MAPHVTSNDAKDKAFYSAVISAWVSTLTERDKALIALSAAGVGLLATLLRTLGLQARWHLWLYVVAFLGYIVTIVSGLVIYRVNAAYLKGLAADDDPNDHALRALDCVAFWFFMLGLIMTVAIALSSSAYHSTGE